MSTFDVSSHGDQTQDLPATDVTDPPYGYNDPPGEVHHPQQGDGMAGMSTLDELRAAGDEVDEREPITVANPRDRIRLTLRTNFEQKDVQRWQFKALPLKHREMLRRRGGQPNLSLLDPVAMFASAIAETTIQVEVRSRATGEWSVVTDQHTGDLLTFADAPLRQILGGLDTVSAVKRAFNRSDPALLDAGQQLLDAAGFGADGTALDDDETDPTTAAG